MTPWDNSSRQGTGRGYTEQNSASKWCVPRTKSIFPSKTPWWTPCVTRHIVMVYNPLVKKQFWPHLLSQMSQNLEIKILVNSATKWDKLLLHNPFAVKEINQHSLDFRFWHLHFFTAQYVWRFPLHALPLCLSVIQKKLNFHPQWWLCSPIPWMNKNFTLILSLNVSHLFSWQAIQTLFQLNHNSTALITLSRQVYDCV
jgi:hypothetical protein